MKIKYLSIFLLFLQTFGHFSHIGGCGKKWWSFLEWCLKIWITWWWCMICWWWCKGVLVMHFYDVRKGVYIGFVGEGNFFCERLGAQDPCLIDWDVLLYNISLIFIVFFTKIKNVQLFCQFLCHEYIDNHTFRGIKKVLTFSTLYTLFNTLYSFLYNFQHFTLFFI